MLPNCKSRRGATLAEIMVALGVVAIMIVMVVSFALLISEHTRANAANLEVQQDRVRMESGVEAWLAAVTKENADLSIIADNKSSVVTDSKTGTGYSWEITQAGSDSANCRVLAERTGKDPLSLTFAYGVLKGQLPNGDAVTVHAQSVETVDFYLVRKETAQGTEYLLYCVATGEQGVYTFCVNPRVGETGGGS